VEGRKPGDGARAPQPTRLSIPDFEAEDEYTQPWDLRITEDIGPLFALLEATGTFRPGSLESQYAGLFFEALGEGAIGDEERERLNLAAATLGLSEERRAALEAGWRKAYQGGAALGQPELPIVIDDDPNVETSSLPLSLLRARAPLQAPPSSSAAPTPAIAPALAHADPDVADLTLLFDQATQRGDKDARYRIASVLARRRGAPGAALRALDELRPTLVPKPLRSVSDETWLAITEPTESFLLASSIFREVAGPALLARASAYRFDGRRLEGAAENLSSTKTTAVRAFAWCAAHLGVPCPSLHVSARQTKGIDFVPTLPPTVVLGRPLLEAEPFEVAFECARHLALHRPEHFVTLLVPDVDSLDDVFHAALLLVVSDLPLDPDAVARAALNRDALRPALDAESTERLRHLVRTQMLVGMPDLDAWVDVVERTADRIGLLLAGDLAAAARVLSREPAGQARLESLEAFWISRLAGLLRRDIGVELGEPRAT
jgi:hypothetical protein